MDSYKPFSVYLHVQICSLGVYEEERAIHTLTCSFLQHVWLQDVETCCDTMSEVWLHFLLLFSCLQPFLVCCVIAEAMKIVYMQMKEVLNPMAF